LCGYGHGGEVYVDVFELEEALFSEASGHLEVSGGVINAQRFFEVLA
jgi:hypothetical protein